MLTSSITNDYTLFQGDYDGNVVELRSFYVNDLAQKDGI